MIAVGRDVRLLGLCPPGFCFLHFHLDIIITYLIFFVIFKKMYDTTALLEYLKVVDIFIVTVVMAAEASTW